MTVNITVDLAAKSASLDRRVAAGEKITAAFAGLWQDWGAKSCRLRIADADGAATLAEASAPAEGAQGAMAFELDLDTAGAAAATAGRAETPALLLLESIRQDGGRELLARQQIPLLSWPKAPDDHPPAPLPDTVAQRLAALEGGKLDKSGGAGGYAFSVENGHLVLADADGRRFQFTNGWDGNDVARLWDTAGGGGGYALVDGGDLTEEGQSLYPADRAVTKWACAGYAGANLTPPDERYDGAVRDFIVDFDNTAAGASDFTVTLDSGYDYIAVGGELELAVAGGEYRTFYFSERPGGVFAVASAALAAPGSGSRSAAAPSGGVLERGSLEPAGRESLGELERESLGGAEDEGEEPEAEDEPC